MNNATLSLAEVNIDLETAAEDALYDTWIAAHADELAADAEVADLVESYLRF